jgi:hypothetical protein
MKISFPGGERQDFLAGDGALRIGSLPENDIVLPAAKGVRPQHLEIQLEPRRGITLSVREVGAPVQVNGRPVKEKAILRLGDVVIAGGDPPRQDRAESPRGCRIKRLASAIRRHAWFCAAFPAAISAKCSHCAARR